ncbi:hypothetical protein RSOLAG22IIIB_11249 [Rhizoctonia solani]|uniref:F-box domain-containing protein n=1 Tax=Rhizoctonia solani TaxID=456999 RepID=A0A0K6G7A8_9AGAM|nr:hypothetical protein RSOLAG22IIIB_11249 [Rhizoctonia solani]
MVTLTNLPFDCLVSILSFLPSSEVETCKMVSRTLHSTISNCLPLQYKILLNHIGYVATRNTGSPSLELKISVLREMRTRMDQRRLGQPATVHLDCRYGTTHIHFSRGFIVAANTPATTPLTIQLHSLASFNRGKEYECSLFTDRTQLIGYINLIKIEIALDLLVLVEYRNDGAMKFHLRSLKTGLPHPNASRPTIVNGVTEIAFPRIFTHSIEILDRRIAHSGQRNGHSTPLLTVWDWTTGDLVTSTPIPGTTYAFVSNDIFVVPSDQTLCDGEYILLSLSVFTLEGVLPGKAARFVATLCLPKANGPSHSDFKLYYAPLLSIPNPHESHIPAKVFDLDENSHYLALRLTTNLNPEMWNVTSGILFIHSLGLCTLAERLSTAQQSPVFVRWDNWGFMACWLGFESTTPWRYIYGHRAAFLRINSSTGDCEVLVYDLRVTRPVKPRQGTGSSDSKRKLDEQMDRLFGVNGRPTRHPILISSFWIGTDVLPKGRAADYQLDVMIDDEHVILIKVGMFGLHCWATSPGMAS